MWKKAICFVACLALFSCSAVTTSHPMGEQTIELSTKEWNGTWLTSAGGVFIFRVIDSQQGVIDATWVDEEQDELFLNGGNAFVRRSSGRLFLSFEVESEEQTAAKRYIWARIKKSGDVLILWEPNTSKLARLVNEGVLPGTIESGDVHLGELDAQHYELITSEQHGVLFEWDQPWILRRVDN